MNSCREFEGKNIDKAVDSACKQLNIPKNKLKYDIISSGSTGIFSIIRTKKAKIRVNIDQNTVFDSEKQKNKENVLNLVDEAFGVKKKPKPKKTPPRQSVNNKKSAVNEKQVTKEPVVSEQKEKVISDFYKGKSSEEIGKEVITKILNYISSGFNITVETDEDTITYIIKGGDSAVIIGKRGQNLEAVQYIVDKIVNKHTLDRKRVLIDVEGYLEKRKDNLEKMAVRMADKVQKTGKPSTISQMSSQDRRIVHLALKDNKSVRTQSMGEGYYRRLVIFPKKGRNKRRRS